MKKVLSIMLALSLILMVIPGCAPQSPTEPSISQPAESATSEQTGAEPTADETKLFTPGVYTGETVGFNGPLKVEVEVSEYQILRVTVGENVETENVGDAAFPVLEKGIVEHQSLADVVSGATFSSGAVISAVVNALKEAGASDDTIKQIRSKEIPLPPKPDNTETDIVVVGAGAAGLMAARRVHDSGGKVILLEKLDTVGGSTKLSAGCIWSLGVEEIEANYAYTADDIYEYFSRWAGPVYNKEVLYTLVNGTAESIDYALEGHLTFSGLVIPSQPQGDIRFTSVFAQGGGGGFAASLYQDVLDRNIDVRLNSPVVELVKEPSGSITGVVVETPAGKYTIKAKKVILATGGFSFNKDMLAQYASGSYENNTYSAGIGGTGDGHIMGLDAGGQMVGNGVLGITAAGSKPGYWTGPSAPVVNKAGKQIARIDEHYSTVQRSITAEEGGLAYSIYGSDTPEKTIEGIEQLVSAGYGYKADSIEELATLLDIDPAGLRATVESLNKHYDNGTDDDLGASHSVLLPIRTAPFYGVQRSGSVMGTIPGLKVDVNMQVLNAQDQPIENLYAIGELIFGNIFNEIYPMSGTANGLCMSSGRIAALDACDSIK